HDPGSRAAHYIEKMCGAVRICYSYFSLVLFFAGKAAFLALLVFFVGNLVKKAKEEGLRDTLIISAGLFTTAMLLQIAVAWFSVFLGDVPADQWWFYGAQNLPFIYAADFICIAVLAGKVRCLIKSGRNAGNPASADDGTGEKENG
ncbi:MAG: hypothetical protein IKR59_04450, partial [Lachnospiraceae bacterium]|nr:hypothetical protein [Lachnospiraceae bacterium]